MKKFKNYLYVIAVSCVLCFAMTGCGNSNNGSTSGNNTNNDNNGNNVVSDVADDVGNAAEDVANGVGNAVNDLVGNGGFTNYNDAHEYFLNTMSSYHADAQFEIRDEDRELNDYQEGSKGYHFKLYDTSKNENGELFGEFYVDATSGKIYKKGENNAIEEYPITNTGNTTNGTNNSTNNGTNTNTNTSGTNTTGNGTTAK
ncbi:MAG: ubiquinone biosynthesis protein [Lachnospiraceae bacterium]